MLGHFCHLNLSSAENTSSSNSSVKAMYRFLGYPWVFSVGVMKTLSKNPYGIQNAMPMFVHKCKPKKESQDNCENDFKIFEISSKSHILNISGLKNHLISLL